jgi:hypothetical protein
MPDFDQRQWGTYNWTNGGAWSHCGPVAIANSLWWLDSKFEPNPVMPPVINDGFPLVKPYGAWDDHSTQNVQPLIEHLAFLMDTDGRRTGLAHSGTNINDTQAGLAHYLSWSGVNPLGDVNGDGIVDQTDVDIVTAAMQEPPQEVHDVAIENVVPSKTIVVVGTEIIVDVYYKNEGTVEEQVGGVVYIDSPTGSSSYFEATIAPGLSYVSSIPLYLGYGDVGVHDLVANISVVPGEVDVADNTFVFGEIEVVLGLSALEIAVRDLSEVKNTTVRDYSLAINGSLDSQDVAEETLRVALSADGSQPGMPNWNLAADVFPASLAYPPATDNVINQSDLDLVTSHLGQTGLFYEHTVSQPDFSYIAQEIGRCQDVVLLLGYWRLNRYSGEWYREDGHYVTVAGVDLEHVRIVVCDPHEDAFERGLITEGRVPIAHVHTPPEPPYTTHNNASYVSHDGYGFAQIPDDLPPCPGGNLTLDNYVNWKGSYLHAVIEYAVVTSPIETQEQGHDVAVTHVTTAKTGCLPKPTVGQTYILRINVTVQNQGNFTETFNATVYATGVSPPVFVGNQKVTDLLAGETRIVPFSWTTTGVPYGSYNMNATAETLLHETDVTDNTLVDGPVDVVIPGDIDGNHIVNMLDLYKIALAFGATKGSPNYVANCDIEDNGIINMLDLYIAALHFGQTDP